MSKELPPSNDELLFPEKPSREGVEIESKDIRVYRKAERKSPKKELLFPEESKDIKNYETATKRAREGKIGIFSVQKGPNGQVIEIIAYICDKNGDLIGVHCSEKPKPDGYTFLGTDQEQAVVWTEKMIRKKVKNRMNRIFTAIFTEKR